LPFPGNTRLDRRHRHLGSSARDQGSKDNPEWFFLTGIGCASEHESEGAAGALNSCGDAGVGRLEAEAVPSLDGADLLGEAAGHREKFRRINMGGDMPRRHLKACVVSAVATNSRCAWRSSDRSMVRVPVPRIYAPDSIIEERI
jgi:hypothetical protein